MSRLYSSSKGCIFALVSLFYLLFGQIEAQVNLKAGYNFSIMSDPGLNEAIKTFNGTEHYTKGFKEISWLHGFEAGARFKADIHALELTYQSAYQALSAEGQILPGEETYTDKINLSVNSFAAGYQVSGELFGGGLDIQFQQYNSRVRLLDEERFKNVQEMWGMKFYLMLTLEGSGFVDAAIQPYVVLPFGTYDPSPINQYLNQESGPAGKKWTRIGISFVFYNGSK